MESIAIAPHFSTQLTINFALDNLTGVVKSPSEDTEFFESFCLSDVETTVPVIRQE